MNLQRLPQHEDALDLLTQRAIEGLSDADASRLDELLASELLAPIDADTITELDLAVAEFDARAFSSERPSAQSLAAASRAAEAFIAGMAPAAAAAPGLRLAGAPRDAAPEPARGLMLGGWLAAAACLTLAAIAWWPGATQTAPAMSQQLASLRADTDTVSFAWAGMDDLALSESPHRYDNELSGEVVWNPKTNAGYMVFEGLAANDPAVFQYQLWIFDAERRLGDLPQFAVEGLPILTQRPVDGGVFDVSDATRLADGRVVIPINAKLPIGEAAVFAITVEPPGGVVVSDRDIVTAALVG